MLDQDKQRLKLSLLKGENFVYKNGLEIKNYTLKELLSNSFNLSLYYYCLDVCTIQLRNVKKQEDLFNVLLQEENLEKFVRFINFFIVHDQENGVRPLPQINTIMINNNGSIGSIDKNTIEDIIYIVRKMYCAPDKLADTQRDDLPTELAEMLKEFEEEEIKVKKANKQEINIYSIIESIATTDPKYNFDNIWDLTMYKLYAIFKRKEVENRYNNTLMGIYTGNIIGKNIDIDKIHWARDLSGF